MPLGMAVIDGNGCRQLLECFLQSVGLLQQISQIVPGLGVAGVGQYEFPVQRVRLPADRHRDVCAALPGTSGWNFFAQPSIPLCRSVEITEPAPDDCRLFNASVNACHCCRVVCVICVAVSSISVTQSPVARTRSVHRQWPPRIARKHAIGPRPGYAPWSPPRP